MFPISQSKETGILSRYIANPKERRMVLLTFIAAVILILFGVLYVALSYQTLMLQDSRHYKENFKQLGSISRIGFFAVIAIYPVFLLLKWKKIKGISLGDIQLKTILQFVGKWVRKWHVPVALISSAIALLHGYLAIIRGFKLDFTHLTGIVTTVILFLLMFLGLKRYKRMDKQWHLKLGIVFLVLFMIHATFS
ncbi:hypothetical protein BIV60_08705 [Bacillus sp. MUM 116]|uniref:hypothetical protein n=1 Tax=Bacillus sp. MUM 116 TaxID=1678002 RepID=UPI0008F5726D|nr:hypothetical protein [Bacillus sp. MUM 116]OIK15673.1 hypothetical protein BIV60_08705 [Bacillus sp. MUM 116]